MARDMTPVLKRCRALDIEPAYLGIDKKSNRHSNNGARPKKKSEYGTQLQEKQKAKFIYGVLEKPFRNYFEKAEKLHYGTTGENLMILLETRLDNVIFRLGFARTRSEAKQIVSHRNVTVNGKVVNIASYAVKPGDVVEIKEASKGSQRYKDIAESTNGRLIPEWLSADAEKLSGKVVAMPTADQIDVPVNAVAIVELYNK
ncbi:MAG: 30S ribosomal protein S4 [Saccharofermentans sp.]|nr:30S ribosomal protein S4 [Saccharofermentans sp.]